MRFRLIPTVQPAWPANLWLSSLSHHLTRSLSCRLSFPDQERTAQRRRLSLMQIRREFLGRGMCIIPNVVAGAVPSVVLWRCVCYVDLAHQIMCTVDQARDLLHDIRELEELRKEAQAKVTSVLLCPMRLRYQRLVSMHLDPAHTYSQLCPPQCYRSSQAVPAQGVGGAAASGVGIAHFLDGWRSSLEEAGEGALTIRRRKDEKKDKKEEVRS